MEKSDIFRIGLTGGGSGGHIYPLLAMVDAFEKKAQEMHFEESFVYFGPKDSYAPLFAEKNIKIEEIAAGKIRRYASFQNILDVPKFFIGFIQSLWKLYWAMPDVLISKGGTGAFPVVVAAWFYRIPVMIHESDVVPGLTNRFSARFAKKIFLNFDAAKSQFPEKKVMVTGAPVRKALLDNRTSPELAKEALGFSSLHPLILVLGGSQGALRINNFILANLPAIIAETQVLHQTGVANFLEAEKLSRAALLNQPATANRYVPVNYFTNNYGTALMAADVVVSRAGAGSIFEIAAYGKPAILIPLSDAAGDHQRENAYAFSGSGAAVVLEEENLLPGIFLQQIKTVLDDDVRRKKMSDASLAFFNPNAADMLVQEVIRILMS